MRIMDLLGGLRARDWSGILGDNGEAHSFGIFAKIQAESPAGLVFETCGARIIERGLFCRRVAFCRLPQSLGFIYGDDC